MGGLGGSARTFSFSELLLSIFDLPLLKKSRFIMVLTSNGNMLMSPDFWGEIISFFNMTLEIDPDTSKNHHYSDLEAEKLVYKP